MSEPVSRVVIEEAASEVGMPSSCFKVLLCLLRHRGRKQNAFPSVARIAEKCSIGQRTAKLAIKALTAAGWINRTPRHHETWVTVIRVGTAIAAVRPPTWRRLGVQHVAPQRGCNNAAVGGATMQQLGVQPVAPESFSESFSESTTATQSAPAQANTASPDDVGRAGVKSGPVPEEVPERRPAPVRPIPPRPAPRPQPSAEDAPHPMLVKRAGPFGAHPEQREAALAAVHEAPVTRGTRNLTLVDGPAKRPPVYRVAGKELPGALSELLPAPLARQLSPHFRGDEWRSGTQKLFEATDLRFLPGASSEGVRVDLALHFDRVWGVRPKALAGIEVPYIAYGVDAREDLERLWTHRKGVCPGVDALIQLVPDDDRRKAMIAELRALGGAQIDGPGWRALSEAMQARLAAK